MRFTDFYFRSYILAAGLIGAIGVVSTSAEALPVTSGLQLWFDATDDTIVFDENGFNPDDFSFSGLVSEWHDKSVNGLVANAESGLLTFSSVGMNGQPTIVFDGGDAHFRMDGEVTTSNETIFVVTRMEDEGNNRGPWIGNFSAGVDHGAPGSLFNDRDRYFVSTVEGLFGPVAASAPTVDSIVAMTRQGGSVDIDENGDNVVSALQATGDISINAVGFFAFGGRDFFGEISEILLFDRVLSGSELNAVGFHLADKYALETLYTAPPSIPEPATLSLLATGLIGASFVMRRRQHQHNRGTRTASSRSGSASRAID